MNDPRLNKPFDNRIKTRLNAQQVQVGLWSSSCSNLVAELLSYAGFDWILLDTEHAPNDLAELIGQMQAMTASPTAVIVRPAWNDTVIIKRLLDAGVQNFLIPFVQSAEEARAAVAAVRYPPHGVRGVSSGSRGSAFGMVPDYWHRIADHIGVIVQIETKESYDRIDDICAVDGVDAIFIGPHDLAASIGHLVDTQHADVQALIRDVPRTCARHGKTAGILASSVAEAQRYVDLGYTFVGVGSDLGLLKAAALQAASAIVRPAGR